VRRAIDNWRSIANDKEKYNAYLCSREWNQKRIAVHKRAHGKCEQCRALPIAAVHHVTYARKYNEDIADLQGLCEPCHAFTHGQSDVDILPSKHFVQYVADAVAQGLCVVSFDDNGLAGVGVALKNWHADVEMLNACLAVEAALEERSRAGGRSERYERDTERAAELRETVEFMSPACALWVSHGMPYCECNEYTTLVAIASKYARAIE